MAVRPDDVPPIDTRSQGEDESQGPDMFEAEGEISLCLLSIYYRSHCHTEMCLKMEGLL